MRAAPLLAVAFLVGGCEVRNAGLLTITGPANLVRRIEIEISAAGGSPRSTFTVPEVEGEPLVFPRSVSFTFPSSVGGVIEARGVGKSGDEAVADGMGSSRTPAVKGGRIDIALQLVARKMPGSDMGVPADMAAAPDLVTPPDMAVEGDLAGAPDQASSD